MENKDNKELINLLTEEELKEITGGVSAGGAANVCNYIVRRVDCLENKTCKWEDGKCVSKFFL